jgi:urocanate hydratase
MAQPLNYNRQGPFRVNALSGDKEGEDKIDHAFYLLS